MDNAHVAALQARHADIDARIVSEAHRPAPDATRLATLKKQKLRVKEAIQGL